MAHKAHSELYKEEGERLPAILRRFQMWTVILYLISTCFHVLNYFVLHKHGFLASPFSGKLDRFGDFAIFYPKFVYFHQETFWHVGFPINYPTPVSVVLEFFFVVMAPHAMAAFVTFAILSFVIPCALFGRTLVQRGIPKLSAYLFVTACCLFSWPFLLIIDRANAEIVVFLAVLFGVWMYSTGRLWWAAIFFGVAASLKLFPFVFLALFLSKRGFPKLIAGAVSFFVASIISLQIVGPTISSAFHGVLFGLNSFKRNYMAEWRLEENSVDHSVFALMKLVLRQFFHHPADDFTKILQVYLWATAIIGLLLYFIVIRNLPLLNQVLALTICSIYFTAFSGDGTLIHLYCPLALLILLAIEAERRRVHVRGLNLIMYCMLICLSLESFLAITYHGHSVRFIGQAHCVALGIMLVAALRYELGPPLAQRSDPQVVAHADGQWLDQQAAA